MRTGKLLVLLLVALALHSCFKKDKMIAPHPKSDATTDTIPLTQTYLYQVYFSLDSARSVATDTKTSFDLGFECSQAGWHILLNSSDFMKAGDMGTLTLGEAHDTTGLKWLFDKSDGDPDSTAIGQWFSVKGNDTVSNKHLYAINRGMDELGNNLGIYQVQFDSLKNNTFYFRYAPLKGGAIVSASVNKVPLVSCNYFSLKTGTVKQLEPPRNTFDLLFTQYTTLLFTDQGIPYPYLVTGVLSNRQNVKVALDSVHDFISITKEIALAQNFSGALDAIGYNWKFYSFSTGSYTIRKNRNYLVQGITGKYYKLRFIGFYNLKGQKGYPVIEYQQL